MPSEIRLLLDILDRAFTGTGWHGTTLLGALRGVTPRQALWRPAPGRHNVWELALHAAYWKYVVRRRITGAGERGAFPRAPSNWPDVPEAPTAKAWREDVRLLKRMHAELVDAVASLPPSALRSLWRSRPRWRSWALRWRIGQGLQLRLTAITFY